jgi:NADH-quinone oxidoreductase subunit N
VTTPEISWLAILPELLLALGAAGVLLVDVQWRPVTRVLGAVTAFVVLAAAGVTVVQWIEVGDVLEAGTPDELVVFSGLVLMDGLAVFGRLALIVVTAIGLVTGWRLFESLGRRGAEAIALVLLATAGFSIMVSSNNLVMLFLGLEVGSIALYVLAGMTRERMGSDEAAMKYFLLGSFASALFIYGVALLYAGTGELEIIGIREFFVGNVVANPAVLLIGLGLIIVGLGFKVSAAPFHAWAPDVYQGAPAGVVGYMAGMAKVAGFAALARIFLTGVVEYEASWVPVMAAIAALSMLLGSVLALVQSDLRRLLAYSGVAHAGFIMTGIVGGVTDGVLFYVVVYAIQLVGAFAVVSAVSGPGGSASAITEYRGLSRRSPALAAGFAVLLLGMGGLPLTAGFVAKFGVFSGAWANGLQWLVIVAVLGSVVAFAFYLRVIVTMYMEDDEGAVLTVPATIRWVLTVAVIATILWGVSPGFLLDLASDAIPR